MVTPVITITKISAPRISRKRGMNTCLVEFTTDSDLYQWEARADANGHGTGALVGQSAAAEGSNTGGQNLISGKHVSGRYISAAPVAGARIPVLLAGGSGGFDVTADELNSSDKVYKITVYGEGAGGWNE